MEQIPQEIIDKIQKLLNLKEGAEAVGSLAEAENAASKMQNLLLKYNLDLATVQASTIAKKAKMEKVVINCDEKQGKNEANWVTILYVGIASHNLCRVFHWKGMVEIIGRTDNIAFVNYMADQLIAKIRIAEKLAWKKYEAEGGFEKRGTYRRGFFHGASYGISSRLRKDMEEAKQEGNEFAVVIRSNMDEVNEFLYTIYPHMRPPSKEEIQKRQEEWDKLSDKEKKKRMKLVKLRKGPKGISSNDGYTQGWETGKRMEINKGVENTKNYGEIS